MTLWTYLPWNVSTFSLTQKRKQTVHEPCSSGWLKVIVIEPQWGYALMPWDAGVVQPLFTLSWSLALLGAMTGPICHLAGSLPPVHAVALNFSFLPSSLPVTSFFSTALLLFLVLGLHLESLACNQNQCLQVSSTVAFLGCGFPGAFTFCSPTSLQDLSVTFTFLRAVFVHLLPGMPSGLSTAQFRGAYFYHLSSWKTILQSPGIHKAVHEPLRMPCLSHSGWK